MQHRISIWRETLKAEPIHMSVHVDDLEYNRMVELVKSQKLTATQAYDKMKAEKIATNSKSY